MADLKGLALELRADAATLEAWERFELGMPAPKTPVTHGEMGKRADQAATIIERLDRERLARIVDPEAWAFYDRYAADPIMKAEIMIEVAPSLAKADAIISHLQGEGE